MAASTFNIAIADRAWTLAAGGPGEFRAEISKAGEYAIAASTPSGGIRGHLMRVGEPVDLALPSGVNLYVRATGFVGGCTLIVSSGQ